MKSYSEIRQELKRECQSVKYFTRAFLETYAAALETNKRNAEKRIDDSYNDGGIWTRHAWDDVRKTDFYLKNSCAYCVFLQIVA